MERRLANGIYAWELVASRRMQFIAAPADDPRYTLIEPGSQWEWRGIPVAINSAGLRGPELRHDKAPGVFRILNLGDSVAMGWGARLEDTYGIQLRERLNAQAGAPPIYESLLAGVPGWNLENELAFLKTEGLAYRPDLIVLELTLVNDVYGKNALARNVPIRNLRSGPIEWLRVHTYSWSYLSMELRWAKAWAAGRDRIDVLDPPRQASSYFPPDPGSQRWDAFLRPLGELIRVADKNHISLILLMFPLEYQVVDLAYPVTPQRVVAAFAAEKGVPVVDLLPVFRHACVEKAGGPCALGDRYLFADVWMHPSALAHGLTAQSLLPYVPR